MSNEEQALICDLNNLIQQSEKIINLFTDIDMKADNSALLDNAAMLISTRDGAVKAFFNNYSHQDIEHQRTSVEVFLAKDKALLELCAAIKDQMAKQVILQKRNKLAAKAYQNI